MKYSAQVWPVFNLFLACFYLDFKLVCGVFIQTLNNLWYHYLLVLNCECSPIFIRLWTQGANQNINKWQQKALHRPVSSHLKKGCPPDSQKQTVVQNVEVCSTYYYEAQWNISSTLIRFWNTFLCIRERSNMISRHEGGVWKIWEKAL